MRTIGVRATAMGGMVAVMGLVAAACGSSGATTTSSAGASTSGSHTAKAAVAVELAAAHGVGKVLVAADGLTVYSFSKDGKDHPTCAGSCAKVWPPLTVSGTPGAGSGVKASMLGTVKDADGKTQVTYNGRPLYTYVADTKPGQAAGQGINAFGGKWWAMTAAGAAAGSTASTGSGGSSSGGGGGW